jgi:thioredoxin 1
MITDILSVEQFDTILNNTSDCKKHVIVDFYADWCKPCKEFNPTFKKFSDKYNSNTHFLKVNIDTVDELSDRYNIIKIPAFMFFDIGNIESGYETITGKKEDKIEQRLQIFSSKQINEDEFDF